MNDATQGLAADAEQIGDRTDAGDCVCIESRCLSVCLSHGLRQP